MKNLMKLALLFMAIGSLTVYPAAAPNFRTLEEADRHKAYLLQLEFDALKEYKQRADAHRQAEAAGIIMEQERIMRQARQNVELRGARFEADEKLAQDLQARERVAAAQPAQEEMKGEAALACSICADESIQNLVELSCSHLAACSDCLKGQIESVLKTDRRRELLTCPTLVDGVTKCGKRMTESEIRSLIKGDAELIALYDKLLEEENLGNVSAVPGFKRCPGTPAKKDCGFGFINNGKQVKVDCPKCHAVYCGNCLVSHPGISCAEEVKRKAGVADQKNEAVNNLWLIENTKPCPSCTKPIEKNYGCKHMTCRCRHEFCWDCLLQYRRDNVGNGLCGSSYCANPVQAAARKKEHDERIARARRAAPAAAAGAAAPVNAAPRQDPAEARYPRWDAPYAAAGYRDPAEARRRGGHNYDEVRYQAPSDRDFIRRVEEDRANRRP